MFCRHMNIDTFYLFKEMFNVKLVLLQISPLPHAFEIFIKNVIKIVQKGHILNSYLKHIHMSYPIPSFDKN